ncbi:hypothetical protein D3C86_1682400 [compost metagenome]
MADSFQYLCQPQPFGVVQWAAAPGREAVAVDPHQVDVAAALGDAFVEQLDTLVDQHQQAAVVNFLIADDAALDAQFASDLPGQCDHFRVILALTAFVTVIAATGLLAKTAQCVKRIGKLAVAGIVGDDVTARFAHQETDIDARQIVHGHDPHRQAKPGEHLVNLRRGGAFQQ